MSYKDALLKGLRPQKILSVSEWSDSHRVLTRVSSSEAGRWRTDRTPYLRKIMDCLSASSTYQKVIFMKGSQIGAPLLLNTKVPTPKGTKFISQINTGDFVYGSNGLPIKVLGKSSIFKNQKSFRVTFDCGAFVDCDYRHLWTLERSNFKTRFDSVTISTDVLFETYKSGNRNRYRLKNIEPIENHSKDLPIDPYTLGAWLGDGHHTQNRICANHLDANEIGSYIPYKTKISGEDRSVCCIIIDPKDETTCPRGHLFSKTGKNSHGRCGECHRIRSRGDQVPEKNNTFGLLIRKLELYGNKHIPKQYLQAAKHQRLAMLQGLMDTDGYCSKNGLCEFTSTNQQLAKGALFLASSLGLKPKLKLKPPGTLGKKPVYSVQFTAYHSDRVFKLSRKLNRLKESGKINETKYRRVICVEEIENSDTVCIKVDSDDNLFAVTDYHILTHNTEAGNNWIGYTIDHDPSPMLVIQPIDKLIRRFVKQRIDPLIEGTPVLSEKFSTLKKDQSNTIEYKAFTGGALVIAGANSPSSLRSMPSEKIFADEVDAYPKDVGGEGDPLSLAEARQRTFARKKSFIVSTPVEENNSLIEELFLDSDQNYFYVPCPECGEFQTLIFEQLKWETDAPQTAVYECVCCQAKIQNWQKTDMLDAGEWRAENPNHNNKKVIGFHLNGLYSPVGWLSWEEIAVEYDKALASNDDNKMKVFNNTILGVTHRTKGEVPDWNRLWERSRNVVHKYNTVPNDALFLTCGVDIQKDRIELEIVGWGRDKVSWSVDYRVYMGDTSQSEVYKELDSVMTEQFPYENEPDRSLKISVMCVDTGYNTQTVYNWLRKYRGIRVCGIKGNAKQQRMIGIPKAVDVKRGGTTIRRGLKLWSIGVNMIKEELYSWLRQDSPSEGEPPPVGFCHFQPYAEEHFLQLTSEQLVSKKVKGYEVFEWQKIRERNEVLDIRVYNRAAASIFGIDRFKSKEWQKLEYQVGFKPKDVIRSDDKPAESKEVEVINNVPKKKRTLKLGRSSLL